MISPLLADAATTCPASDLGLPPIPLPTRASRAGRFLTLMAVVLPLVGVAIAFGLLWGWGVTWVDLGLLFGFYLLTALGITVGFHRLFTHRSFETYGAVKWALAVLGSMTIQGPLLRWVAWHRRHHQFSDEAKDPHTPHHSGSGVWGWLRGWWHSHIGWFFRAEPPDLYRYVSDLQKSKIARWGSITFPIWAVLGIVLPAALAWVLAGGSWTAALRAALWAGAVRVFLVHHVTWSVNSICHMFGSRTYKSDDESRDNLVFGVLALGEGWHNSHHAFPTSARHGLRWWQLDISYLVIRTLEIFRLVWNVRRPSAEAIAAAQA